MTGVACGLTTASGFDVEGATADGATGAGTGGRLPDAGTGTGSLSAAASSGLRAELSEVVPDVMLVSVVVIAEEIVTGAVLIAEVGDVLTPGAAGASGPAGCPSLPVGKVRRGDTEVTETGSGTVKAGG